MADSVPSFVKKGREALEEHSSGSSSFISLKDGDMVEIVPLHGVDEVITIMQHRIWIDGGNSPIFPCLQTKDCPGCMIGDKPSFRGMMVVMSKGEDDQKILPFGISLMRSLAEIEDVVGGSIRGAIIRVSRKGSSATNTKYNAVFTGRRVAEPAEPAIDLMQHIGESDRLTIIETLKAAGKWAPRSGVPEAAEPSDSSDPWASPKFK